MTSVVVTGRGAVTSLGEGADTLFDGLIAGRSGIVDGFSRCAGFDVEHWMSAKEARRADRFTHLAVAAADQAADDAGLLTGSAPAGRDPACSEGRGLTAVDPSRLGVVVGTGIGGLETLQRECRAWIEQGERAVSPNFVPMMMPNAAAGTIAIRLGIHGPGFSVSSACATGGHAIGEALRLIQRGEADMVLAGGTDACIVELCVAAFSRMGALSKVGISRPFDARRDGFVLGEGAAVLVLEREEHALARGATIYARIAGYGASSDGFDMVRPDAEGRGALAAMSSALVDADAAPGDVDYVNCHGTGTPYNDRIETLAMHHVWNGNTPLASSTKSAIGHLIGAAGAVEALVCVEAARRGIIPPTLNYEEPDPDCDLDYVPLKAREAHVGLALTNSMGFGGQNTCLAVTAP